jgi:threonine dehydrogenase-like Zn-dependent dehydrogenase
MAGAAYGFAGMGPFNGGQAEYLRVPYGDFNCLRLPPDAQEKELDYVMVADIFPTGWHYTELAGLQVGESIVIYRAGPVGLMAALSATIKGASILMVVDRHPDRLKLAERCYDTASVTSARALAMAIWFATLTLVPWPLSKQSSSPSTSNRVRRSTNRSRSLMPASRGF